MKKFLSIFACIAMLFSITSCEKTEETGTLLTPYLKVTNQPNGFTATWNEVANATSYAYTINGEAEKTTTDTKIVVTDLAAGDYTLKVKAVGTGYTESDYATKTIKVVAAPTGDWYTQELSLKEDATAGTTKENSVYFRIKGKGIVRIYITTMKPAAMDVSEADVIASMKTTGGSQIIEDKLSLDLMNSESGGTTYFGGNKNPMIAGTSYVIASIGVHESGVEKLCREVITTEGTAPASVVSVKGLNMINDFITVK